MKKIINLAVIQHPCKEDKADNIEKSIYHIKSARASGADIVLLPELHCTRYFCVTENAKNFNLAETIPGPTTDILAKIAEKEKIIIIASVFEKHPAGVYHNTAVVFEKDGNIAGIYRKTHIPDDPGYHEKFYFTPGNNELRPIKTSVGSLGVMVCWDQWFPEAARLMALAGADILIYPSAIGWDKNDDVGEQQRQREAWQLVQRAHAVANCLPVMTSNRVGLEPDPSGNTDGNMFWGSSFIAGPQGELLALADEEESVICAKINLQRNSDLRKVWTFFRGRRTDIYQNLSKK